MIPQLEAYKQQIRIVDEKSKASQNRFLYLNFKSLT